MSAAATPLDRARIRAMTAREAARFNESTPACGALYGRAKEALVKGVGSSYHFRDPWPIYIREGRGSRIWDVDGNEYIDYLMGYGSMINGHAHPAVVEAVTRQLAQGTQFCEPTESAVEVAEELARRWGLPKWRFTNSGTESTMEAIRIARTFTGRETVVKILGSFHGHHDAVMVSIDTPPVELGARDAYPSTPYGGGIPKALLDLTVAVPFNDAEALERRLQKLEAEGRPAACLIMEAAMMNLGIILPQPGYLERVREITRAHGVVLIFDEVKTGFGMAPGGATEYFGVTPDMVAIAKGLGGGVPCGGIGGTPEVWRVVEENKVWQVGTFNANPLTMSAARATLFEVLTPEGYAHLARLRERLEQGCRQVIDAYDLPAYPTVVGAKGCITFSDEVVTDYESYVAHQDGEMMDLAWLFHANRGVFTAPGRDQEFTLSVQHSLDEADRYVEVFGDLAAELTA